MRCVCLEVDEDDDCKVVRELLAFYIASRQRLMPDLEAHQVRQCIETMSD